MKTLQYKIITSKSQYKQYCDTLHDLLFVLQKTKEVNDEIDLLTLLIEKWDNEHSTLKKLDPVQLLISFMKDHKLNATEMAGVLDITKGTISDILNYRKSLSKQVIRKLSDTFKVNQDAFNRDYPLRYRETTHKRIAA